MTNSKLDVSKKVVCDSLSKGQRKSPSLNGHGLPDVRRDDDAIDQDGDDEDFVDAQDDTTDDANRNGSATPEDTCNKLSSLDLSDYHKVPNLRVLLKEVTMVLELALKNQLVKALDISTQKAHKDLYASLTTAALSFLRAALTLNQADLKAAVMAINQSFEVSSRWRRKVPMVVRFIYRPNYNTYSDHEVHAELVHAESLLLLALVSFIADQSIICLVRGAFKIRTCYQRYKECLFIMENRRNWNSEEAKQHFESGVRMGHGIFNMLMSYLPRRVLRFLEYVGFSGNRNLGQDELNRSIEMNDGLRSVFSTLCVLANNCYVETLFGLGNYNLDVVKKLTTASLEVYSESAFFLIFLSRYHQMQGQLELAIKSYQRCIDSQNDWKQIHTICHWEMMWCYAVQMDWKNAATYADLLRKHSRWSPSSYTYMYATFLYASLVDENRAGACLEGSEKYNERIQEIRQIMEEVPKLKIRYAGKTIPAEKFAITRAIKFCDQNNRLSLPALEFLYIWNIFVVMRNCPSEVEKILARINSEVEHIEQQIKSSKQTETDVSASIKENKVEKQADENDNQLGEEDVGGDNWIDDLSLMHLLKGMCMKHLMKPKEAEDCFIAMELACLKLSMAQYDEAKHWIKSTRNNYTHYLHETIVHFKLHAAGRTIRLEQQDHELTSSSESTDDDRESKVESAMMKSIEAS